jgi:hypothetical protein
MKFHTEGLNGSIEFSGTPNSEGWMSCQVNLRAPGFEANYGCSLLYQELERLHSEVSRLFNANIGMFEWGLMEAGLHFNFERNHLGHIIGKYELRSRSDGPRLVGNFLADQTHLRLWMGELEKILHSLNSK